MYYLLIFYLAIPCLVANMAPLLAARYNILKPLDRPLDFGKEFKGKRLLGNNKTVRGLVVGIFFATLIAVAQYLLQKNNIIDVFVFDSFWIFVLYGFLSGLGAILGDAVESFIKRRLNIKPGRPFFPYDQIDYMIGFLLLTSLIVSWNVNSILFLLVCGIVLNPIFNFFAYIFKIKNTYH